MTLAVASPVPAAFEFGSRAGSSRARTRRPDRPAPCCAEAMLRYFGRLEGTKVILWCYLAWYVAIVALHFDPAPGLWLSSAGISVLIGFALNLATRQQGVAPDRWVTFRLYLFPFCVSSYSALIKGKGFILLFPRDWPGIATGAAACLAVLGLHLACRRIPGDQARDGVVQGEERSRA